MNTRDEIFDALAANNVKTLRSFYAGGGDEGFVEGTDMMLQGGKHYDDATDLIEAIGIDYDDLEEPINEALGDVWYDGEPDQQGYVFWYVDSREVTIKNRYTDWVEEMEISVEEKARRR